MLTLKERYSTEFAKIKALREKECIPNIELGDDGIINEVTNFYDSTIIPRLEELIINYLSSSAPLYVYTGKFTIQFHIDERNRGIINNDYVHASKPFVSTSDNELLFKYFQKIGALKNLSVTSDSFEDKKNWIISIIF